MVHFQYFAADASQIEQGRRVVLVDDPQFGEDFSGGRSDGAKRSKQQIGRVDHPTPFGNTDRYQRVVDREAQL